MSSHGVARECTFLTTRLSVGQWHVIAEDQGLDLAGAIASILTESTTRALPGVWQGGFTLDRARRWIHERNAESSTLLAVDRQSGEPVALVILFEQWSDGNPELDLRLGYVLAEAMWGRGLASELVEGIVAWARSKSSVRSITGGVEANNVASARVLTKNGFSRADEDVTLAEHIYTLVLRS